MPLTYRRPGVYLEESLLINPSNVAGTLTVAAFVGVAEKGQINSPVLVESWNSYTTLFGGMNPITPPATDPILVGPPANPGAKVFSYLPYSVYSFFQNGGRFCYIIRSAPKTGLTGTASKIDVNGADTVPVNKKSFTISAKSVGVWGDTLKYALVQQRHDADLDEDAFALQVYLQNGPSTWEVVETYSNLSVTGAVPGTRQVGAAINDPFAGSRYITISDVNVDQPEPVQATTPVALAGGVDPGIPNANALISSAQTINSVEGPITLNICGYASDLSKMDTSTAADTYVSATVGASDFPDREDVMVINDSAPPCEPGQDPSLYAQAVLSSLGTPEDSYVASYTPWLIIPDPRRIGQVVAVPPGGAIAGVMARIDATVGVFRAPAGTIAGVANAVGVQAKFTDTDLGDLNSKNINVVRPVVGSGICVMGGRTRKSYGADRYVSARRTLISIKESLRRSTQWAVFENNDARLWSGLRLTADRILRPMWESGGLAGGSASEAYFIRCDETLNTPNVVQSGEVRMEVGVALEYPAEFVIIKITQFDRGSVSSDVTS